MTETMVAFWLAIKDVQLLFPAALSIAPGMMTGAIIMKTIVPQSTIPGIIMLQLPWLIVPLVWSFFSLAIQGFGNTWLFLGLAPMAFQPFVYVVLGRIYQLDWPMSDKMVIKATKDINKVQGYMSNFGLLFLTVYIIRLIIYLRNVSNDPNEWFGLEKELLLQYLNFQTAWGVVSSGTFWLSIFNSLVMLKARFYLSSVAALDCMVGNMVDSYIQEQAVQRAMDRQRAKRNKASAKERDDLKIGKEMADRMGNLEKLSFGYGSKDLNSEMRRPKVWLRHQLHSAMMNLTPVKEGDTTMRSRPMSDDHSVSRHLGVRKEASEAGEAVGRAETVNTPNQIWKPEKKPMSDRQSVKKKASRKTADPGG